PAPATPPGAAAQRAAGGQTELDPGKSTQRGNQDYAEGKSVITDADTMVEIGTILQNRGRSELKLEDMATELRNRGYNVEVTEVDGKKAIRFPNGDIFVDSSGDGQLGTEDVNFQKSLANVEQKFGIDLSGLKGSLAILEQRHKLEKALKKMDGLGMAGLFGEGMDDQLSRAIREILARTDTDMQRAGYRGNDSAYDLWQADNLEPVLKELNVTMPDLPAASELAYGTSMMRATRIFQSAYEVAGLLGRV
ncbi:MAG: hypothetical protein AB1758_34945, partial [Candidatus Eremiobacterota bacterium]